MNRIYVCLLLFSCTLLSYAQGPVCTEKALIGISCAHPDNDFSSVRRTYSESVLNAGGIPILIPIITSEEVLATIVDMLDGLILTGGEDVHPRYYNEEPIEELGEVNDVRDVYDLTLIRLATERKLPTLGICRGEQLINVAFGGSLYQDIPAQYADSTVKHNQEASSKYSTHYVTLLPGSTIATLTGEKELCTNTHHHQAVKQVAPGFKVTAWACDSIPEAIESCEGLPMWGVQFHPEPQAMNGDSIMIKFFEFLNEQALQYRSSKVNNRCKR